MESHLGSMGVFSVHTGGRWGRDSLEVNGCRADCRWFRGMSWGVEKGSLFLQFGSPQRVDWGYCLGSMDNSLGMQLGG